MQKPKKVLLDNGIPLYVINIGTQPIFNIQILFKAGRWQERIQGATSFVSRLLFEGTPTKSAEDINRAFDQVGAYWEVNAGMDYLTVEVYTLSKHLPLVLSIVKDCLQNASFPQNEFSLLQQRFGQQLKINMEKNSYKAAMLFREYLFGKSHPYGYPITPELVDGFSRESTISHYQDLILGQSYEIIIAGEITDEQIKLFNQELGSANVNPAEQDKPIPRAESPSSKLYLEKEDASQSSIRIGKVLLKKNHPDSIKMEVLNEILGGYFGSRLMKNIREKRGLTYGIYSSLIYMQHEGYFVVGTDVKKERLGEALEQIYLEIERLTTELVTPDELHTVKNYMAGNYIKSINTPVAVAEYFKTIYFNQLNDRYYDTYVSKINKITSEDVIETAKKYLQGDFAEILVG
ncbi:pitrilysin family protein [Flammeovirgaceae bacterium SG7u.111]|nr:pitrilysin family protein [Flammeovirgaceae bacterium SG7u.132]WPO36116.1 pitrilysin family protein [Flammeovirgaceae bacterium SG7u.111]